MNTNALVGGIVEHWFKLGENRPTIVFTSGVKHSVHLQREFQTAGVVAEHIDAKTPLEDRKRIIAEFRSGLVKVLCNCMIFIEGFDEPSASCVVLARPTKLLTMYRQMVGRVLRPHLESGKADARILDHSGAVYRHGYPDDEIEWPLSPDEKAVNQSEIARAGSHRRELTTCPRCTAVRLEGEGCRRCGWKPETRPAYLEVADGELGEVRRDRAPPRPTEWSASEQLAFYRQLMWISRQRQYRAGWAAHKFRERCGRFPPWDWNRAEPLPASGAVAAWVRSRSIAYAKSRTAQ
jgi:superfamily II DNA or RNA helicase